MPPKLFLPIEEAILVNPNRREDIHVVDGPESLMQPAQHDRHRGNLAISFDNGTDCLHEWGSPNSSPWERLCRRTSTGSGTN